MKSILKVVMLGFFLLLLIQPTLVDAKDDEGIVKGLVYGEKIIEVKSKEDLDASLIIKDMFIEGDKMHVNFNLKYNGQTKEIKSSGEIYESDNLYLGGHVIDLESTEEHSILSFKIEENAKKELLLPINEDVSGETVIKFATIDKDTDKLIYFEDVLTEDILGDIKKVSQNINLDSKEASKDLKLQKEENFSSENWFYPFLEKNSEGTDSKKLDRLVAEKDQPRIQNTDDFIPMMHWFYYEMDGEMLSTYRNGGGYYKNTVIYPVGSENLLTKAFQWAWVHNAPGTFDSNDDYKWADGALELTHQGQFIHIEETGEVIRFQDEAGYRMKNPTIKIGIGDGGTEILSAVNKTAQFTDESLKVNLKSYLGYIPFLKNGFLNVINSLNFVEKPHTTGITNYSSNIGDQDDVYNEVQRGSSFELEDQFFKSTGDRLNHSIKVQIPTDDWYVRNPGERDVHYRIKFDIYTRNMFGFYTEKVDEVSKLFREYYEVLE